MYRIEKLLLVLVFFSIATQAKNKILYQKNEHIFTQRNLNETIVLGEFIARDSFSKKDKKNISQWLIDDFKAAPKKSKIFYESLSNVTIPKIKVSRNNELYRAELYLQFINMFKNNPQYTKSPHNFLAIIEHYNPPKKDAKNLQLFYARQLQYNNQMFNSVLKQVQTSSQAIHKSLEEHGTRQSIVLSGDIITAEFDEHIVVEGADGIKYEIEKTYDSK
ncbi:MAG TPA: hypothetical protein EYG94_05100 [Campylobacterales bacterium]|nr:hypothetical protein [Campylobacterales bacterium]